MLAGALVDAHIRVSVLQVREILLQASQQGPEVELPAVPWPGEQPLSPRKRRAQAGQDPPGSRDGQHMMAAPLPRREGPVAGQ